MELKGSIEIAASPKAVWDALNDPEALRQCIPGCEEVKKVSAEELHARVALHMGPVRARFAGKVLLSDIRPLEGYTLNFEGSGGTAGFAKGSSLVTLTAVGDGTQLNYTAQAAVAGKLGQIGGRLMDATAGQLAAKFFANLKTYLLDGSLASSAPLLAAAPAIAPASGAQSLAALEPRGEPATVAAPSWIAIEAPRLMWFFAGVFSTALGVWMGAHWLR